MASSPRSGGTDVGTRNTTVAPAPDFERIRKLPPKGLRRSRMLNRPNPCPEDASWTDPTNPDTDGDGISSPDDDCPDEGLVEVDILSGRIVILEKVHFKTASDEIRQISHPLLAAVFVVLQRHPEIALVEIQGHTDERGDDADD